jgi:hypothetical protein
VRKVLTVEDLNYVNDHLQECRWPFICPHPSCDTSLNDEASFQFHLIDSHGFSRTRPGQAHSNEWEEPCSGESFLNSASTQGGSTQKRKRIDNEYTLTWMPLQSPGAASPLKKSWTTSPTICPSSVFSLDTTIDCNSPRPEFTESPPAAETCLFDVDGMHGSPAANDVPLNPGWRPETSPSFKPSSADGALSDDSIFL